MGYMFVVIITSLLPPLYTTHQPPSILSVKAKSKLEAQIALVFNPERETPMD